ncbi:SOS response-associated peptidase family protein (plasmid) [Xanthomonas citri pv. citri]|uniref:SOS response-associated peptidase family protein n=1 Tax=Xanthomonas citri TaxID=346 RepID=UPI00193462BE|nr:SOS response-associated peptidase family protein [Xanthomonas citri]QRD62770.1 SOS response-associated peptidase family protein [Xanthomonas citri pv. citri]QRD67097.1 SOS response-associated peptidase family protein [Xanthomonas citri pv. citri]QRD71650.1 SOS response-associated peptidase family protein [Xanthomonas citri pv. citri]
MCYSAEIQADYKKLVRHYGAIMSLEDFAKLWLRQNGPEKRPKTPKAMDDAFRTGGEGGLAAIAAELAAWDAEDLQAHQQELFKQAKRLADAERVLAGDKPTKKAANDQRIATTKIEQIKGRIADLQRTEPKARDYRIFPGYYAPVIISEGGRRVIKPMRYQCRPAGKPSSYDTKYPGTYNARRDNLEGFWGGQFGHTHGLMIVGRFYENVEGPDGRNRVVQFQPRDKEPMLVACLWSHWTDPKGKEPDLLSFAAITDEPEPEVAEAGHDRTIINIKPEHIDAWLNPDPANLRALYDIFDDKRHPYYEHKMAA